MKMRRAPRAIGLGAIAIYRAVVSPVIHAINGPACRFEPSCSEYARDAIAEYGIVRGGMMAIWRIARCNPIGGHGFDPVPQGIRKGPSPAAQGLASASPHTGRGESYSPDIGRGENSGFVAARRTIAPQMSPTLTLPRQTWEGTGRN